MRAFIRSVLTLDPALAARGVVPGAVLAGDVDTPRERPFIQLRWNTTTPGLAAVTRRELVVWVHDEPNDYTRIDDILRRVKTLMASVVGAAHSAGHITTVEWTGDSADLTDDGHGTITRTTSFSIVGTGQ